MERMRESELRFRQLAENINEVFFLLDAKTAATLYVSPAYSRIWQRSVEHLYRNTDAWMESVYPEDRATVSDSNANLGRLGSFSHEFRIVRPDGTLRWIKARGFPIRDASGDVYRVAGIAEDISESKQQELSIKRLSRILRVLSNVNSTIVRTHNREALLDETCRILHDEGGFPIAWIGLLAGRRGCKDRSVARSGRRHDRGGGVALGGRSRRRAASADRVAAVERDRRARRPSQGRHQRPRSVGESGARQSMSVVRVPAIAAERRADRNHRDLWQGARPVRCGRDVFVGRDRWRRLVCAPVHRQRGAGSTTSRTTTP